MILLELRAPRSGREGYDVVATLSVVEDQVEITGDRRLFEDPDVRVRAPGGWVRFAEDPETWARHLHTAYRTPYLVPVVVVDSGPTEDPVPS